MAYKYLKLFMKDLSEDVVHSFPGFEKLLEPFKITGDAKVKKDLVTPKDSPHYSANSKASDVDNKEPVMAKAYEPSKGPKGKKKIKKARKKLKESINNFRSNTMKSQKNKFDELFENVMGEEDLDMTLGTDGAGDMEMDADLEGGDLGMGMGAGAGEHGDLHAKIEEIINALNDLKASLAGSEGAEGEEDMSGDEDEGEEDLSDADDGALDEEGMETPEEAIVSEPEPKAHNPQPAINQLTGKSNKPTASGYAASTGKADSGKIPNVQADPKAHNPQPAINAMTGKNNKPNSKLGKVGEELFKV
jgi:hypothetical protein